MLTLSSYTVIAISSPSILSSCARVSVFAYEDRRTDRGGEESRVEFCFYPPGGKEKESLGGNSPLVQAGGKLT